MAIETYYRKRIFHKYGRGQGSEVWRLMYNERKKYWSWSTSTGGKAGIRRQTEHTNTSSHWGGGDKWGTTELLVNPKSSIRRRALGHISRASIWANKPDNAQMTVRHTDSPRVCLRLLWPHHPLKATPTASLPLANVHACFSLDHSNPHDTL